MSWPYPAQRPGTVCMSDAPPAFALGMTGGPGFLSGDFKRRGSLMKHLMQAGIDHLFVADHISFHTGLGMDGLINAATLAAMHPNVKVLIGVYLLALRHPVPVARQLSSLCLSAPGRITLGVGVGGEDRHEMEICGVDPAKRGRQSNHSLAALRLLLSGEPVSYDCEFFRFSEALIKPAPKPPLPIMIGGRSPAARRRTALYGDGWLGVWCSPARFGRTLAEIHETAEEAGREPKWRHGLQLWAGLDRNRKAARARLAGRMEAMYRIPFEKFEKYSPFGCPEEVAAFLLPYLREGAEILNVEPVAESTEAGIDLLAETAELLRKHASS